MAVTGDAPGLARSKASIEPTSEVFCANCHEVERSGEPRRSERPGLVGLLQLVAHQGTGLRGDDRRDRGDVLHVVAHVLDDQLAGSDQQALVGLRRHQPVRGEEGDVDRGRATPRG